MIIVLVASRVTGTNDTRVIFLPRTRTRTTMPSFESS